MPDEQPPRAADAQPAAEQEAENSEEAQEAVDIYRAGVANANPEPVEVVDAGAGETAPAETAKTEPPAKPAE